jgi:teichuronic acid biosynthesis glycosyltransferase TuaH
MAMRSEPISDWPPAESGEGPPSGARDVVFTFNYVTLGVAMRRGMSFAQDRLAARLLADARVDRLVIADPFRSVAARLAPGRRRRAHGDLPAGPSLAALHPLRLRRRDPASVAAVERCYRAYDRRLRRAAERLGLERPVVITAHPLIAGFSPLEWSDRVVFYATDDWTAHPAYSRWWPAYRESYQRIRELGRSVCAVSQPIIDRVQPTGPATVIPNGVEPSEWMGVGRPPGWLEALPSPRLLYIGTLDSRLDVRAVRTVASAHPQASVVLVGPTIDEQHIAPLRELPNVHIRANVDRATVPAVVTGCDVGLVPHVNSRLTSAMSPLKIYEYLAGGRPVASIDLPPVRDIDSRVVTAPDSDGFAEAVATALLLGPASETERRAFLDRHSWRSRHSRLLDFALGPA